ncbi:hypothetical protein BDW22DRAFT_426067 [Trametopsis cervina]|nr:hypothetical protein BDW22DRAFT_426067 [Trametopsis cervina]
MANRKRTAVPAALHSELTEYSSLLRALRTSNTLDLASQLTTHASVSAAGRDEDDDELIDDDHSDDAAEESERPLSANIIGATPDTGLSDPANDSHFDAPKPRSTAKNAAKKPRSKVARDTWTRWPLLAGDVHVPEWSLEDEVKLLAVRCLKSTEEPADDVFQPQDALSAESSSNSVSDTHTEDVDDDLADELLPAPALHALTTSCGRYLSQVLALLAAHVPPGEKSMQNRVRPINWESVLNIAATNGLVNNDAVQSIRNRLGDIYPTSVLPVTHNYPPPKEPAKPDFSFLTLDGYDPTRPLHEEEVGSSSKSKKRHKSGSAQPTSTSGRPLRKQRGSST